MSLLSLVCASVLFLQWHGILSTLSQKESIPDDILYTALGDSLAFGVFAPFGHGYVYNYRTYIEQNINREVKLLDLGVPGWKSKDLLKWLKEKFVMRFIVSRSSIVTFNIGGNDVGAARKIYKRKECGGADNQDCLRATVESLKKNWDGIIAELHSLRNSNTTLIRTMDIYNPLVNEDKVDDTWPEDQGNDFQVMKSYLDQLNSYICTSAEASGIPCARIANAFNGTNGDLDPEDAGLMFIDRIHPNGSGHILIADIIAQLGYAPFRQ